MPRRKTKGVEQTLEPAITLMLPAPQRSHKHGEHEKNAYEAPPGAVPGRASNEKIVGSKPLDRKLTADEKKQQVAIKEQLAAKAALYHSWLDALVETGGDRVQAAMQVTGRPYDECKIHLLEIVAEIQQGRGASEITDVFARNDLDAVAQAAVLRKWTYSENAAASLNAIKIINDMTGDTNEVGSFESFLRLSKLQGKG